MAKWLCILIFLCLIPVSGFANCPGKPWPKSRNLQTTALYQELEKQEKSEVLQYVLYDINNRKKLNMVAPLLQYLILGEMERPKIGFYKLLGEMSLGKKHSLATQVERWPRRLPVKKVDRNLLCRLYSAFQRL